MKKSQFSEEQVIGVLQVSEMTRLRTLEEENRQLNVGSRIRRRIGDAVGR